MVDSSKKSLGLTEELEVNIRGHCCNVPFYVLDSKYDIILGLNWQTAVAAGIRCCEDGKRVLEFRAESFDIDLEESVVREANDDKEEEIYGIEAGDEFDIEDDMGWQIGDKGCKETFKVVPETELSRDQVLQFDAVVNRAEHLFAFTYQDLGECLEGEHVIRTTSEVPIALQPSRVPEKVRKILKEEIAKMLNAGIIRQSRSA